MTNLNDLPTVLIKRKNIQTIFDYCLDTKVEFTVREKPFTVEEFEVILQITDIKHAIAFGIFARENKIDVVGVTDKQQTAQNKTTRKPTPAVATKAPETKENFKDVFDVAEDKETEEETSAPQKQENMGFSLDLPENTLSFS